MKLLKYGPEHDQWKKKSVFNDCLKVVEIYETITPILAPAKPKKKRRNG